MGPAEVFLNTLSGGAIGLFSGALGGAAITWLFRQWISERLKQSIQHEYASKIETHKAELNTVLQAAQYERQLHELRTSLFFDYQRQAFASLLSQIAETRRKWLTASYRPGEGLSSSVPFEDYQKFERLFYDHQLFLDRDCIFAAGLVLEAMTDSFAEDDGNGASQAVNYSEAYSRLEFLQVNLAELFQEKIGIASLKTALYEIALLSAIRLLNRLHFSDLGLPVKGTLQLASQDTPSIAVLKARNNRTELISRLKELESRLEEAGFYGSLAEARNCLRILA